MAEYKVTLLPSNQTFTVHANEIILDAAIRQGIETPYTCRNGTCRTCIVSVTEGTIEPLDAEMCMISEQELQANRRLLCMSQCKSDAVLEKAALRRRSAIS